MQQLDALSRCTNVMIFKARSFKVNLVIRQAKVSKTKNVKTLLESSAHKLYEMRKGVVYIKSNDGILLFYENG